MRIRSRLPGALRQRARDVGRRLGLLTDCAAHGRVRSDLDQAAGPAVTGPLRQRQPDRFIGILVCSRCRARVAGSLPDRLICHGCGCTYDIVDGVPVLLARRGEAIVEPLANRSNPVPDDMITWLKAVDGYSLNLGAGATEFVLDQCVELEHAIFRNTDVVGDAHQLPFADGVFEAVLCLNTFEHLRDPRGAAAELLRVMRPGGRLVLKTAFLQPVPEEPYHLYDATRYGLLAWFENFRVERCFVPADMSPALALGWFATDLLHYAGMHGGAAANGKLASSTLAEWRLMWVDANARRGDLWDAVQSLPEEMQGRLSAGFQLEAVKPD